MAFEPIYDVAVLDGLQKLCSGQVVAEAKLVPPHGEEISKILGVSAVVDVTTTEVFTGEARIKGKVDFRVLYVGSGGEARSLDYRAEFTDKITDDSITGGHPCVSAKVLDTDIVSASESEVRLAAVVETELFGLSPKRVKYLVSGGEGIYSHDSKVGYTKAIAEFDAMTDVSAEATVAGNKLCAVESRICVRKTTASTNMVVVEGDVVSDVVYSGESGMGHVLLSTPFSFEAEAEGSVSGATVCATARIADAKASIVEGEENTVLINYDVSVCGFVLEEHSIEPVLDVFSVRRELDKTTETTDFILNKQCVYIEDEAEGNITLEAGLPIVDNIITPLGNSVILTSVYATDGKVVIEGLVRSSVIYFSGESNSYSSVAVELPFSLSRQLDVKEGDPVFATSEVLGVYTKIRRGNEIDVRADLRLCVCTGEKVTLTAITELSEGAEIEAPKGAISLHIASKKETLWDVAKVLSLTPEAVLEQNPGLTFPLSGGERIICFRKL